MAGYRRAMATSRMDKNSIFFRFASEGNAVEKVDFHGREIAVGDLRQQIADMKRLSKLDLVIVNEATNEVYLRDGIMLSRNMSVTVRRTPVHSSRKPAVVHVENTDVWARHVYSQESSAANKKPEAHPFQQRPCPPEYLCPLCEDLFDDPSIARCCGRSACSACFSSRQGENCPLCSRPKSEDTHIPNPRLGDIIASLNVDYFEMLGPRGRQRQTNQVIGPGGTGGRMSSGQVQAVPVDHHNGRAPGTTVASTAGPPLSLVASGPPGHFGVPLPGVTIRPCMLTPEQFHAWQHSLRGGSVAARSRSEGGRTRRHDRHRDRRRRERSSGAEGDLRTTESGQRQEKRKRT